MPIQLPNLDDRRYQQLVDEALARIPVHTPEWTNFNPSDPGVTLIQVFAFLTESLLYRCNQIPERNRKKFLQLLGVPLRSASSARGLVTFDNSRGPLETITLSDDVEVRAGQMAFRTERGLDVLPVEARVYFKMIRVRPPADQPDAQAAYDTQLNYYRQLYESLLGQQPSSEPQLYEAVTLESRGVRGVDLGSETVDQKLWIALLLRANDKPPSEVLLKQARDQLAGKALSIGIVPQITAEDAQRHLVAGDATGVTAPMTISMPSIPANGGLPDSRQPSYRPLLNAPVPVEPAIFDVSLPEASQLILWDNLEPLEAGTNKLPPALDDTALNARLITWISLDYSAGTHARVQWAGINAAFVDQRAQVLNEIAPVATGEPDQEVSLVTSPVIADSVEVTVILEDGSAEAWTQVEDLLVAGPEVPTPDPGQPPGVLPAAPRPSKVFVVEAEAGKIRFGDGFHGARPPLGATIRVNYDYGSGTAGNVGEKAISSGPALPAGMNVANPIRTWGGADAEQVQEGEKQVTRYLQHRERLVNAADFATITFRTPGVQIGRVEVLAAYNPDLARHEPGNAPGAVTLMVIPRYSATRPDAPEPDQFFLQAICNYLSPRRLVTTELFVQGPEYQPVYISVDVSIVAGRKFSEAVVRKNVEERLRQFLAPFDPDLAGQLLEQDLQLEAPSDDSSQNGWPLRRPVIQGELLAEVARVPGVAMVNQLEVANPTGPPASQIAMQGLQLPRLDGIQVTVGSPIPISQVRGDIQTGQPQPPGTVPVPAIPAEC
jgi:predicted phage baseplate assembly protein